MVDSVESVQALVKVMSDDPKVKKFCVLVEIAADDNHPKGYMNYCFSGKIDVLLKDLGAAYSTETATTRKKARSLIKLIDELQSGSAAAKACIDSST